MTGTASTDDVMTFEKLQEAMELVKKIPPAPFMASSRIFGRDQVYRFDFEDRQYCAAHPDTWDKVAECNGIGQPISVLGAPMVHNIDTDEQRRIEFMTALAGAMAGVDK